MEFHAIKIHTEEVQRPYGIVYLYEILYFDNLLAGPFLDFAEAIRTREELAYKHKDARRVPIIRKALGGT